MGYDGSITISTEIDIKELKKQVIQAEKEVKRLEKNKAQLIDKKSISEKNLSRSSNRTNKIVSDFSDSSEYKRFVSDSALQMDAGKMSKDEFYKQEEVFLQKNAHGYAAATKEVAKYASEVERYDDQINVANKNIAQAQALQSQTNTQLLDATNTSPSAFLSKIIEKMKGDFKGAEKSGRSFFSMLRKEKSPVTQLSNSIFGLGKMFKLLALRMALRKVLDLIITGFKNLADYSSSFNNTMSGYQSNMQYLGNSLSTAVAPVLKALLPLFDDITNSIVNAINAVSAFTARLFGMSATYIRAKKAQSDFTNGTQQATKAQNKQMASFDTIEKLSNNEITSGAGAEAGGMFEEVAIPTETISNVDKFKATLQPTIDALGRLKEALSGFGATIWSGLVWGYDNILVPLGNWTFGTALPVLLDILTASITLLDLAFKAIAPVLEDVWEKIFAPAFATLGDVIIEALDALLIGLESLNQWAIANPEIFQVLVVCLGGLLLVLLAIKFPIVGIIALGLLLIQSFSEMGATTELLVVILGMLAVALLFTVSPIMAIIAAIALVVYAIANWGEVWKGIVNIAQTVWDAIVKMWEGVGSWFENRIFKPIRNGFKSFVNGLIGYFEGFVNFLIKGINNIIDALNRALSFDIPDWVPFIGGNSWSIGIPNVSPVSIPRLATGTVVSPNNPFMAMLGDNTNEQEIVSPLSTMKQALAEVLEVSGGGKNITIVLEMDNIEFGRAVYKANNKEKQRVGVQLAKGGRF